jgi:O-succinylbenzoic acid--CoA ligase
VVAEGRAVTYRELDSALRPVAGPLVEPARGTHEFAARLWSAWRSGVPFVPHDPRLDGAGVIFSTAAPQPATVILTSGTTGEAKAVGLTAENHEASAIASAWNLGVAPDDRWLCCLPLWHVGGLAILHRSAIYGTTAVVHDGFDVDAVRESLESGEATLVSLVATMLQRLIDAGLGEWPALRAALVGGGPIPRGLVDWAADRGFPLVPTYGMTETASQVVTGHRPLLGVELRIGDGGEILVRGPMVAPGAVDADGWLHTADRGRLDDDGLLYVEGRIDDVIVTGGENVAALEVEEALLSHPAVRDAAVAGRPDPEWGEAVTAYVVLAADVPDADLLAHCRAHLAGFKVPKAIHRVEKLPRNAAGKLQRARL